MYVQEVFPYTRILLRNRPDGKVFFHSDVSGNLRLIALLAIHDLRPLRGEGRLEFAWTAGASMKMIGLIFVRPVIGRGPAAGTLAMKKARGIPVFRPLQIPAVRAPARKREGRRAQEFKLHLDQAVCAPARGASNDLIEKRILCLPDMVRQIRRVHRRPVFSRLLRTPAVSFCLGRFFGQGKEIMRHRVVVRKRRKFRGEKFAVAVYPTHLVR